MRRTVGSMVGIKRYILVRKKLLASGLNIGLRKRSIKP